MNVLIYRAGDSALSSPGLTNAGLAKILGTSQNVGAEPAPGDGLIVDFMGGTTDACLCLQTIMENSGNYGLPTLGPASKPDPAALRDLTSLVAMAGSKQATYCDAAEQRLLWFAGASGRALVGLTETLGPLALDQVGAFAFRPLPVSDLPITKIPTFTDPLAPASTPPRPTSPQPLLTWQLGLAPRFGRSHRRRATTHPST
jgi:thiamine pyridinylase